MFGVINSLIILCRYTKTIAWKQPVKLSVNSNSSKGKEWNIGMKRVTMSNSYNTSIANGTKYLRMNQVKLVEGSL